MKTSDALNVAIDATPATGAAPLAITLKATVDGQPPEAGSTYAWDLGDGNASTDPQPAHTYAAIGDYTVKLTLKSAGKSGHATRLVHVVTTAPGVDLSVAAVDVTPGIANPSSAVTVKITLHDSGTEGWTNNIVSRVYLYSGDTFDEASAILVGAINTPGIGAGADVDDDTSVTVPGTLPLGDYWIWVEGDAPNSIHETDEPDGTTLGANNLAHSTTKLTVTDGSLPVDLHASVPTLSATTGQAGQGVTVDTTIGNGGTATAGAFTVKIVLSPDDVFTTSDLVVDLFSVPSLAAGASLPESRQIAIPSDVINRPWYVGVLVDSENDVLETDETNNQAKAAQLLTTSGGTGCTEDANEPNDTPATATALTAASMTGLELCGASSDWFSFDLGMGDRLSATIGFQNVNGNLDLAVYKSTNLTTPIATSNGTGNTETVDSGLALANGTYYLKVTMAGGAGNAYDLSTAVQDNGGTGIDLVPTAMTAAMSPIPQGTPVAATVTVYDFGTVDATAFDVDLWLSADATLSTGSDIELDTFSVASLASGNSNMASRTITIPTTVASGWYWLIAHADGANAQMETHEDNNDFAMKVGVGSGCIDDPFEPNDSIAQAVPMDNGTFPDMMICTGNPDFWAITTGAGGTITAAINFTNSVGDLDLKLTDANGATPSDCSMNGNKCSSGSTSNTESVKYTSVSGGTYYVKAFPYSATGKGPYSLTITGSTGSMPDFLPSLVTVSPTSVTAGDDVLVSAKIKNNSTMATPAFSWDVRLSADATIDGSDVVLGLTSELGLAANESRTVTKKVNVPPMTAGGTWYVGVVADPAGQVSESTETNNTAVSSAITVAVLCNDDGYEDNDTLSTATPMTAGATDSGLVICSADPDYYAWTPAASGTLTLHVDFVHANGDLDIRLYSGTTLVASSTGTTNSEEVSYAVTAGQTYKLKVYGFNGATNTYSLTSSMGP